MMDNIQCELKIHLVLTIKNVFANCFQKSESNASNKEKVGGDSNEASSSEVEGKSEEFADRRPEKRKASGAYGSWTTIEHE